MAASESNTSDSSDADEEEQSFQDYLDSLDAGTGCAELWEEMSEHRGDGEDE